MSTNIKLKRSAVAGRIPGTGDLELGELAINTYDGKLYLKKDDGTQGIVDVTAGLTASEVLTLLQTVDGTGSGLDADLLDGQEGTYYLDWTNTTNKPDPVITLTGAVTGSGTMTDLGSVSITTTATSDPTLTLAGDATGSTTFTNLGNATLTVTIADDSHNHIISNIDGLQTALDAKLALAGGTMTGDLLFGDNVKATFGAGSDLQIYHDGGNSVISEQGVGNLIVRGSSNISLQPSGGGANMAVFTAGGDVSLYHNNALKLATTATGIDVTGEILVGNNNSRLAENGLRFLSSGAAFIDHNTVGQPINFRVSNASSLDKTPLVVSATGIDVTGTVTADGLTVDGGAAFNLSAGQTVDIFRSPNFATLRIGEDASNYFDLHESGDDFFMRETDASVTRNRIRISSGGDISFYEDTGTTPKFFWDASAEALGVGETDPNGYWGQAYQFVVGATGNSGITVKSGTTGNGRLVFTDTKSSTAGLSDGGMIHYDHTSDSMRLHTNGVQRIRIDSSGNVGIGTSSPARTLDVNGSMRIVSGGVIEFGGTVTNYISGNNSTNVLSFGTNSAERLRITSTGNVGIGTDSPVDKLHVSNSYSAPTGGHDGAVHAIISNSGSTGFYAGLELSGGNNGGSFIHFGDTDDANVGALSYFHNGNYMRFDVNAAERLRITSTGNVGIGTSSPATALDVAGTVTATAFAGPLTGAVTGNASTATTLQTARAIQVSGAVTGTANFNGSSAINIVTTATSDPTLTLAGDATGSATFTNLGNATLTVAIADDSHNHSSSSGNFTVGGDLIVNGTTFTVNATTVSIDDPIITLGGDTVPTVDDNKDRGIEFRWHNGTAAKIGFFGFDDSTGYLTFIPDATNTSEVFSGTAGDIQATNFRGALVGNATTATTLQTARTIGGVSFNGSANINLPGVNAAGNQSTSGNAASATILQTARTINGVSFNGSANITVADATKLPLTGGTVTGTLTLDNGGNSSNSLVMKGTAPTISFLDDDTNADDFYIHVNSNIFYVLANRTNAEVDVVGGGWETPHPLELRSATNQGFLFGSRMFADNYHPNADTLTTARTIGGVSFNGSANINLPGVNIAGNQSTTGNAATATTLSTTRTITLGGDATGSVSFNGGSNVTLTVAVVNDSHTHDGRYYTETESDARFVNITGDTMSSDLIISAIGADNNIAGVDNIKVSGYGIVGNRGTFYVTNNGEVQIGVGGTHNANPAMTFGTTTNVSLKTLYENTNRVFTDAYHPNADKWTTARTLTLSGAVTGSASIDGSGNVTLATTATADPTLTLAGDATGSATFTNLGNATLTVAVANDSHNHSSSSGNFTVGGDLTVSGGQVTNVAVSTRDKYRVWSDGTYTIGMQNNITFGAINNNYAMTFQMSNTDSRGFWWGDSSHTTAQGAMSLSTNGKLSVAHSIRLGYGQTDTTVPGASYVLDVNGAFAATTKSFVIDHPTKPNMKLRHGSLEGPENGVYVRGRLKDNNTIELPDYWTGLVDEESITVTLTPIGKHQKLFVEDIADNKVIVGNDNILTKSINCFYVVWAERKDVAPFDVEYEG